MWYDFTVFLFFFYIAIFGITLVSVAMVTGDSHLRHYCKLPCEQDILKLIPASKGSCQSQMLTGWTYPMRAEINHIMKSITLPFTWLTGAPLSSLPLVVATNYPASHRWARPHPSRCHSCLLEIANSHGKLKTSGRFVAANPCLCGCPLIESFESRKEGGRGEGEKGNDGKDEVKRIIRRI